MKPGSTNLNSYYSRGVLSPSRISVDNRKVKLERTTQCNMSKMSPGVSRARLLMHAFHDLRVPVIDTDFDS